MPTVEPIRVENPICVALIVGPVRVEKVMVEPVKVDTLLSVVAKVETVRVDPNRVETVRLLMLLDQMVCFVVLTVYKAPIGAAAPAWV